MAENIINKKQTIGTTAEVIALDLTGSKRNFISVTNTSTGGQVITIAVGEEAKNGEGLVLYPGGSYQESIDAGFIPTTKQITAISDVAGATISIHDRIYVRSF